MNTAAPSKPQSQCEIDAVHVLKRISGYTRGSAISFLFKISFLGLMEFASYLSAAAALYVAFTMPRGVFSATEKINSSIAVTTEVSIRELLVLVFAMRITLIISAFILFFIAFLLRKLRKKNALLKKVNDKALDFLERHRIS